MATTIILCIDTLIAMSAALVAASSSIVPTHNYIDTISGYSSLSACAENVLSTIVRAQLSGCGDHMALTSYTCFCTESSSLFSSEISSVVANSCGGGAAGGFQAQSAVQVFDGYCALGVEAGLTTSGSPASTARPSPGGSSSPVSVTATSASSNPEHRHNSRTTSIAVGVIVPVVLLGLMLGTVLLMHKRRLAAKRRSQSQVTPSEMEGSGGSHFRGNKKLPELPQKDEERFELESKTMLELGGESVPALDSKSVSELDSKMGSQTGTLDKSA